VCVGLNNFGLFEIKIVTTRDRRKPVYITEGNF
jgi:hypothetical protein